MQSENNILSPSDAPLSVAVLVLDACNTLSFAAAVDPMRAANRLAGRRLFDWSYVTATGADAALTSGLAVSGPALSTLTRCDLLLVVAGFRLEEQSTPTLRAGLRRLAAAGAALAGVDGGPWILARAGLLDGHAATTHWEDLDRFATTFPEIRVAADRYRISAGRLTCGGALPAVDMMLHLIEARHGAGLARRVAGVFLHDRPSPPDRPQSRAGGETRHSRLTASVSALMEQTLDNPLSVADLARRAGLSPRTLQSRFRDRLGTTPQAHYLALRLSEARRLVEQTDMPLTDIALATGFGSAASFSRAFRAAFGQTARTLRSTRS